MMQSFRVWRLAMVGMLAVGPATAAPPAAPTAATPKAAAAQPDASRPAAAQAEKPEAPTTQVAAIGIMGRAVAGPDGQAIGRVVDVLVDAGSNPRAAVIDFGGFLGVGARQVAVAWSDLQFPAVTAKGDAASIKLDLTADQIKSAPSYTDQTEPAAVVVPPPAPSPLAKPEPAPAPPALPAPAPPAPAGKPAEQAAPH